MAYWVMCKEIEGSRKSKGDQCLVEILSTVLQIVDICKVIFTGKYKTQKQQKSVH